MEVDEDTGEFVHPVHTNSSSSGYYYGSGSCEILPSNNRSGRRLPMVQTYSSALGGYHSSSSCGGSSSSSSNRVIVHRAKRMRMFYP